MAKYSTVLLPYSFYGNSSLKYSQYGTGDIPDLRLRYLTILPTDATGSHLDGDGNAVYGRATLFWDTYAEFSSDIKILRSTHGPAVVHNDPFCSVIAATRQTFNIAATTVRYSDGYTVINTDVPHLLNVGDTVVISGTSNGNADGTWKISTVLNPAQFAFSHTTKSSSTSTGGTVTISVGRSTLPSLAPGEKSFTDLSVVPGNEYHYSLFIEDPTPSISEWHYAGSATIRVPKDFSSFQRLVSILPPYLTNKRFDLGGIPTVDTLVDTDLDLTVGDPSLTKVLAGMGWVWDDIRSDLEGVSRLWEPRLIPDAALTAALDTVGIASNSSLSKRSLRMALANADQINEFRGAPRGLITFSECVTGFNTGVTIGYNRMPTVDDAEFYGGIGHWVASPASVDNSTATSRSLTSITPSGSFTGGDSVSAVAYVAPETPANGDLATSGAKALSMTPGSASNPCVHLGYGVAVSRVSPSAYVSNRVYTLTTAVPHGLERGDIVTMTSGFPYDNTSTNPSMVVTAIPGPTAVTVTLESDITPSAYSTFFGTGSPYNLLAAIPGRRNPFAVGNGVPVSEYSKYTFSYEGTMSATPSSGQVSPTTEIAFFDASGTYISKYTLGNSTAAQYEAAAVAYEDATTIYNSAATTTYTALTWTKNYATFTTPARTKYLSVRSLPVASDTTLTHYFRRFMVTAGETAYNYQSPNLVSIDLFSPPSSATWGPPRINLMTTPSFEAERVATASSGTSSGTTRTITTSSAHGFLSGQNVTVAFGDANYDGTFAVVSVPTSTTLTYTAGTSSSSNATLTTSTVTGRSLTATSPNTAAVSSSSFRLGTKAYALTVGSTSFNISSIAFSTPTVTVTTSAAHGLIAGQTVVIASATTSGNNGTFTVATVPSSTTFTVTNSSGATQASAAGTVGVALNNKIGTAFVQVPSTGTYTASAYFLASNSSAYNTSVRLLLDGYANGYSNYEFTPSTTNASVSNPPASPVAYCDGPSNTGTTTSASWLTSKTEWYDQQPAVAVTLANNADILNNVRGYRSGVYFPRTADSGNLGRVSVSAGSTYRAGAWVRLPSVAAAVGASVRWYDSAGDFLEETLDDALTIVFPSTNSRDYSWVSTTAAASGRTNSKTTTITAGTSSTTTRTITTSGNHGLLVGETVTVAVGDSNYDGSYAVVSVTSPTTFTYTAGTSTSSAALRSTNPTVSVTRAVAAAVLTIYANNMTEDMCGKTVYVTCPTFTLASAPEVTAFESASIGSDSIWQRTSVTFNMPLATDLVPRITARTMGTQPVYGSAYYTDSWLVESGDVLMSYFDGNSYSGSNFNIAPYFAGWTGTTNLSTTMTGRTLPTSAVSDNTSAHINTAINYLRSEIPNNVAIGIPYRITFNGLIDNSTPVSSIDPTFTQTYVSTVY